MTTVTETGRPAGPPPDDQGAKRVGRVRSRITPYLAIFPGGIWLLAFFIIPMLIMLSLSLQQGDVINGFQMTWHFQTYADAISNYKDQMIRSLEYGLISTILQILIAYPVAYWIAFRGGARKTVYLFLLLLPFFVSFVLRTQAWQFMLRDNGFIVSPMRQMHIGGWFPFGENFHILAITPAVIGGLTYNYLPFMVLPIYVALERVDPRQIEAAYDLYASRFAAFRRVIFPLSLPGIFAGVVITFVPVSSDYVNAHILGGTRNTMIGNSIQNLYLVSQDYPTASALAFILMAALLIGIFLYARALGTEDVLEATAR
jgi:spermidine/putrescine transport system permease protein